MSDYWTGWFDGFLVGAFSVLGGYVFGCLLRNFSEKE